MPKKHLATTASVALLGVLVLGTGVRGQNERTKTIFLSMVDAQGKPITDLGSNEIAVAEDGRRVEIISFRAATVPLEIALLADTTDIVENYVQDVRKSLTSFVRRIQTAQPESEIMVMEFGQAAVPLTRFTKNTADLAKTLGRLYPKREAPSVLLEAIGESSRMLGTRSSMRRAIVILNIEPSSEQSAWRPNQVIDELRKSGASVWTVSFAVRQSNPTRDVVLPVFTQNAGGSREIINSPSAMEPKLQQVADSLLAEYELTYVRPSNAEPPKVVQVHVSRPGLIIRAPVWAPR